MQLYRVRGGSKDDVYAKKYNIGVGISLGNKWFTTENILEQIQWALLYTRDRVIVYVADTIHAINLEVRDRISLERALRKVERKGKDLLDNVKKGAHDIFSPTEQERIVYATWKDIDNSNYRKKVAYLYNLFSTNEAFSKSIESTVRSHVQKDKDFSDEEIKRLCAYVLEELPEVMTRVSAHGLIYEAYTYPFDGELPQLAEKLQQGELFPEVRENILDTDPKIFLEVR